MHALVKKHYGEAELRANGEPNWSRIAETPNRVCVPKQQGTQCGHFMVQFAKYWNGIDLIKDDEDFDVSE